MPRTLGAVVRLGRQELSTAAAGAHAAVKPLLSSANPVEALLKVNDAAWSGRNNRLRAAIKVAKDQGRLGQKHYSAATNEFV